ncbi:DUF4129 domain-containing protein [Hymenobacter sp. HSC-4F20]|uniref:DUF4129 domain-containing protein n=1 Tax=Hymenobacter sp. HSC-4F20 TaxID=2864135 RepID=UPI001C737326|nr:DUF4129 domain-containing protein [Hymenobacter sp. HSC-4F20]MBX0290742.1 DUF4129 domain-containing protein [Hymenobacter sp. HSC-4F20]
MTLRRTYLAVLVAALAAWAGAAGATQPPKPVVVPPAVDTLGTAAHRSSFVKLPADTRPPGAVRAPQPERLRQLRQQREFQYAEPETPEPGSGSSLWTRFWWRLLQWFLGLFYGPGYEHRGRYVVYALFGAAFLYVVLRLLRLDLTGLFRRSGSVAPLPYDTAGEQIYGVDFDSALAEAEAAGNYRLAVRLGYLLSLRHLTERGLIRWQPDKTNHEYLHELRGTPWFTEFQELTRQFEYVWYGETLLTAPAYPALREARLHFIRHLTRAAA